MEKIVPYLIIGAVALLILIILIKNICIVQQSRAYVIERLGAFSQVWEVGIHFKLPFVERIARRVSLKEQVLDYPPQPVITKDNVTMQIDTVVYFQITDPKLYTYATSSAISSWTRRSRAATSSTRRCAPSSTRRPTPGASRSPAWS